MSEMIERFAGQFDAFAGASSFQNVIFTSGVIDPEALTDTTRPARQQCEAALAELIRTVELAGGDTTSVLEVQAFLVSPAMLEEWNAAFSKTWPHQPPARTTVIAQLGAPGLIVEVRAIAARRSRFANRTRDVTANRG